MDTKKLSEIFDDRFYEIANKLWKEIKLPKDWSGPFEKRLDEVWAEYLNGIDCTVLTADDVMEDLESIINHSAQGKVCVSINKEGGPYILVPEELAEKALVLGGLPEKWFPEPNAA